MFQSKVARMAPRAVLGVTVAALALSGIQFGMASDRGGPNDASLQSAPDISAAVNRYAKADRVATVKSSVPSTTLAFRLVGLKQTTIVMRLPIGDVNDRQTASDGPAVVPAKNGISREPGTKAGKTMIACELVVSPLTEVAKQLGPGRCLT
jgi:hypothetical protein